MLPAEGREHDRAEARDGLRASRRDDDASRIARGGARPRRVRCRRARACRGFGPGRSCRAACRGHSTSALHGGREGQGPDVDAPGMPAYAPNRMSHPAGCARAQASGWHPARRRVSAQLWRDTHVNGAEIRLGQLFDRESGRSFIAAFDHGLTLGPKPGSENVVENLQRIIDGNPDGILISPGVMKVGGDLFAFHGAPDADRARRLDLQRRGLSGAAGRVAGSAAGRALRSDLLAGGCAGDGRRGDHDVPDHRHERRGDLFGQRPAS